MYEYLINKLRELPHLLFVQLGEHEDVVYQAADAIEELKQTVEHYKGCSDDWYKEACDYKSMLPRWTPVTERLPDEKKDDAWSAEIAPSDDVLCYLASERRMTVSWYSHTFCEWYTVDEKTVYRYGEITHWMPLPEPPKG